MSGFESLSFALVNLSSPPVLAFALGIIAVSFKSDLRLPDSVYQALTIYLLLAIGIKGGVSLSEVGFAVVAIPLAGTLFIGITLPVLAFYILKFFTKLDPINRGALAAHYGSTLCRNLLVGGC
jgi:hypothetical protein